MNQKVLKPLLAALVLSAPAMSLIVVAPVQAGIKGSTAAINTDKDGVALGGYDPVAYFDSGKPTRGMANLSASYGGARYLFATAAHLHTFQQAPKKYVPEFGGFCATGTAFGEKVDVDPETGKVVNGKLYVNNGPKALGVFNHDQAGIISKAEGNWPTVKNKAF